MAIASIISRRRFLQAEFSPATALLRPPWSVAEARFRVACTRCGECISACPTGILKADGEGYPFVDFSGGECAFCAACVTACRDGALVRDASSAAPWTLKALFEASCLAEKGVMCLVCREQCERNAIRLQPRQGSVPMPQLDAGACTGCGACVAPCPAGSIRITTIESAAEKKEAVCT
jgi:ferredoxin-type protein NapF